MDRNEEDGKCRNCGETLGPDDSGETTCINPECPTNKRTKPICQKCRVVMEESDSEPVGLIYKCPRCKAVSQI